MRHHMYPFKMSLFLQSLVVSRLIHQSDGFATYPSDIPLLSCVVNRDIPFVITRRVTLLYCLFLVYKCFVLQHFEYITFKLYLPYGNTFKMYRPRYTFCSVLLNGVIAIRLTYNLEKQHFQIVGTTGKYISYCSIVRIILLNCIYVKVILLKCLPRTIVAGYLWMWWRAAAVVGCVKRGGRSGGQDRTKYVLLMMMWCVIPRAAAVVGCEAAVVVCSPPTHLAW